KDRSRFQRQRFFYPNLAVPVDGKYGFVCDAHEIQAAKVHLSGCSDFLVIGFSGVDSHVCDLLKEVRCVEHVAVIGENLTAANQTLENLIKSNDRFGPKSDFEIGFAGDFSQFISLGALERFFDPTLRGQAYLAKFQRRRLIESPS